MAARKVRRVVRKPAGAGRKPVVRRPMQTASPKSKPFSFSLLPEAHAVGPALGTMIKGGLRVAATVKQLKGVNRLRPTHDKTIKSVTYKNVIEGPIMKKTGGGVPLYKGYDKMPPTFGVMQSGRVDTRLFDLTGVKHPNVGAATRANQAMMSSGPGSAKHTVKKKSFVRIKKGGPVLGFLGPNKTRYRKRSYKEVETSSTLVQGQDPLGRVSVTTSKTGLDKYLAAPAVVTTVPFWDQVGDFFNPMPEAYGAGPASAGMAGLKLLGAWFAKNPKGSVGQFMKYAGLKGTKEEKEAFYTMKKQIAAVHGKRQIKIDPSVGAGKSNKMNRKAIYTLTGGLVTAGVFGGVIANPELNQRFTESMDEVVTGAGTGAGTGLGTGLGTETEGEGSGEAGSDVIPVIPYGTEGSTQTMQEAQTAFEEGLIVSASAAGPQPTIQYGLPNEIGKPDPSYTKMSYKKYAPKHADADVDGFIVASQWVKLGMMGGMTSGTMSAIMTRQANRDKANEVHANVMKGIREHVAGVKGDKLKAAANKAKELYAVPANAAILGSLPRQYQDILNRELTKQEAGRYG